MSARFLLLEIVDPAVNAFLWRIREILSGKKPKGPIHLTLRGPYEDEWPKDALERARRTLRHDVLRIAGVGRFSNANDEVVFFRVDSPHLRKVWWKPSFPISRYGFEPHISLYRGPDAELANLVAGFLSDERIELHCAEHRLVWHESKQRNMLALPEPTVGAIDDLYNSNRIDVSVLDRLIDLTDRYHIEKRANELTPQRHS